MAVLFNAGDHAPVILLVDEVGSGLKVLPLQIGETATKVGVARLFTVMVIVVVLAHWPAVGVNV